MPKFAHWAPYLYQWSLAKDAQESKEAIQKKSVDTQLIYQEGHDLPFTGPRLRGWHHLISKLPRRP